MKIGAVTIGQSPRVDVTPDILPIFGEGVELLQFYTGKDADLHLKAGRAGGGSHHAVLCRNFSGHI